MYWKNNTELYFRVYPQVVTTGKAELTQFLHGLFLRLETVEIFFFCGADGNLTRC